MIKYSAPLCWVVAALAALLLPTLAFSGYWVLYDDFSTGFINQKLWSVDDSSATISVVDGKARFEHHEGFPSDSSWLQFSNYEAENIEAFKATVTVESYTEDFTARIVATLGTLNKEIVFNMNEINPGKGYTSSWVYSTNSMEGDTSYLIHDFFWGRLQSPIEIVGKPLTIYLFASTRGHIFVETGHGSLGWAIPNDWELTSLDAINQFPFLGIGTISNDGSGSGVIYVDDVHVFLKVNPLNKE